MSDLENKVKLENWSCKLTKETKETLAGLQNSGDFSTVNQMMETLIERYYAPIKSSDQSKKIKELETELENLKQDNDVLVKQHENVSFDSQTKISELEKTVQTQKENIQSLQKERNELEQELINTAVKAELPENGHVIVIDPINWLLLKFVAEREGKKRNQEWTPEDVINYFVHHRFEQGDVNGGFKSVPDPEIKKMKDELNKE